jgi:hydroxymethylpyrimidine pyrophosphatase-like HAD family hydrolase
VVTRTVAGDRRRGQTVTTGEARPSNRRRADIRLVALDLDGTILDSGTTISPTVIDAVASLSRQGIACATASGRPFGFQAELLDRHGMGPETGCFAALIADERELYLADPEAPTPHFTPYRPWNDLVRRRWSRLVVPAVRWLTLALAEASRRGWDAETFPEDEIRRRGLATLRCERPEHASAIREWLIPRLAADDSRLACNQNVRLVQIVDSATGKGAVLAKLAALREIDPTHVLALGDSLNDETMLDGRFGFRPGTVGNADPAIKELVSRSGGYVARQSRAAGVVEALTRLLSDAPRSSQPLGPHLA